MAHLGRAFANHSVKNLERLEVRNTIHLVTTKGLLDGVKESCTTIASPRENYKVHESQAKKKKEGRIVRDILLRYCAHACALELPPLR